MDAPNTTHTPANSPPLREIAAHQIDGNAVNAGLRIVVIDPPGMGGANHCYQITPHDGPVCTINFQNGPVPAYGVNGVTQEALLAVVQDRLECFEDGPYPCVENKIALLYVGLALDALHARTQNRLRRGVEGKLER